MEMEERSPQKVNLLKLQGDVKSKLQAGLRKSLVRPKQQNMTLRERKLQNVRDIQDQVKIDSDAYPELKVPPEFMAKFEHDKEMGAGTVMYAAREVQDEMRIRYLQKQLSQLEESHDRDIKTIELKLRSKMNVYVQGCLEKIQEELLDQFKLIFVQLDKVCEKEKIQKRIIFELKTEMSKQEMIISELGSFIKWEEVEHEHFTNELVSQGL